MAPKFFLVGISWVQTFLLLEVCQSKFFFRGYFVNHKFLSPGYFVGPNFSSLLFRGSKIFTSSHFVGPNFFLMGIS